MYVKFEKSRNFPAPDPTYYNMFTFLFLPGQMQSVVRAKMDPARQLYQGTHSDSAGYSDYRKRYLELRRLSEKIQREYSKANSVTVRLIIRRTDGRRKLVGYIFCKNSRIIYIRIENSFLLNVLCSEAQFRFRFRLNETVNG